MLFRYPGSKNKAVKPILQWLHDNLDDESEYREPFFGGGAVGLALLLDKGTRLRSAWFNDNDATLCSVWRSVKLHPDRLEELLYRYQREHLDKFQLGREPGVRLEPQFKAREGDSAELRDYLALEPKARPAIPPADYSAYVEEYLKEFKRQQGVISSATDVPPGWEEMTELAWMKIALHQTSYSGLGVAGGPIGGKEQRSDWIMGCRYTPKTTVDKIRKISRAMEKYTLHPEVCTHGDFSALVQKPGKAVFYLDPPYYEQGPKLYRDSFGVEDHERLAGLLLKDERPWLLSYDDHPEIRRLYQADGIRIYTLDLRYTIVRYKKTEERSDREVKKTELFITNRPMSGVEEAE